MSRIGRIWRTLATGGCFVLFTVASTGLTWLVLPLLMLVTRGGPDARRVRMRKIVGAYFGFMIACARCLGCMRLRIDGAERLGSAGGRLVLATHPTLIDVLVLFSLIPQASCVVKGALFDTATLGPVLRTADYVENRGGPELVDGCRAALARGQPLLIFPEGTRTRPGEPIVFQRGTAHVLLATGCDFIPVIMSCDPPTLLKGDPWYRVPERRFDLTLRVLEPVPASVWAATVEGLPRALAARELTRFLEAYFTQEIRPTSR